MCSPPYPIENYESSQKQPHQYWKSDKKFIFHINKHNPIQKKKTHPNPNQYLGWAQYSAQEKFMSMPTIKRFQFLTI